MSGSVDDSPQRCLHLMHHSQSQTHDVRSVLRIYTAIQKFGVSKSILNVFERHTKGPFTSNTFFHSTALLLFFYVNTR